jgi:hypothetical protein
MKIAIQGHPTRGKEVIQILESLGGCNIGDFLGTRSNKYYYLDPCLNISATSIRYNFKESEIFTLEEFEKEFPFKIGDKVKHITSIGTIKEYCYINNEPAYKVKSMELGIIVTIPAKILEPYKEMERNITLTLEKAKEWYKKGGELKEIALQAFSEKELNPLPRSWEEFSKSTKFTFNGSLQYITGDEYLKNGCFPNKSIGESSKIWHKHVALFQLEQLRDCWWNGWKPDWDNVEQRRHCIIYYQGELRVSTACYVKYFLVFPTNEMAEEFLECFRDLIEKAGDLI